MSLVSFCVSRLKGDAVTVSKEKKQQQELAKAATESLPFQLSQRVGFGSRKMNPMFYFLHLKIPAFCENLLGAPVTQTILCGRKIGERACPQKESGSRD